MTVQGTSNQLLEVARGGRVHVDTAQASPGRDHVADAGCGLLEALGAAAEARTHAEGGVFAADHVRASL
ncbi:hypothetical protein ACU4GD_27785 [Cupriavidus basilensis]